MAFRARKVSGPFEKRAPGVLVHKGMTIVLSLFRSNWLAVVYCSVFCIIGNPGSLCVTRNTVNYREHEV